MQVDFGKFCFQPLKTAFLFSDISHLINPTWLLCLDFQIYKKVANDYRGLAQFAYAFGEDASKM